MRARWWFRLAPVVLVAVGLLLGHAHAQREGYPAPRFPSYLKPPRGIDDLMPAARAAVRQIGGRTPLGLAKPGQRVLLVVPTRQDRMVVDAIIRAYRERGVQADFVLEHEARGLTLEQARHEPLYTGEEGWREIGIFRREMLRYMPPDVRRENEPRLFSPNEREGARRYLDRHPDYQVVFAGGGGRPTWRKVLGPHGDKFYGNWTYISFYDLLSRIPTYPADVWRLTEERTIEPLAWAEEVRVTDPEGTDIRWRVSEPQAREWARGAYLQGHLFMYPLQAGGRHPVSPGSPLPNTQVWLPPIVPDGAEGVIAGTSGHFGFFPHMRVHIAHGMIQRIEGGGKYGDVARLLLNHPLLKSVHYPMFPRPGYWYVQELGLGTNPKYFRPVAELKGNPFLPNSPERNAAGVLHWGFGAEVEDDPQGVWTKFAQEKGAPASHAWHIHNVLPTYQVKIRGSGQWLTLIDRGRLAALDAFEARAVASRYGPPDELLRDDWRPDLPGITAPGDYMRDYARDPWSYVKRQIEAIERGTYRYFAP